MIKKLSLTRFGKFINKAFTFSDVTVFYGKNEAGKTTIFDALFDNICGVGGTSQAAKNLNTRYGVKVGKNPERLSAVEFIKNEIEISPDEFLSLYAVKSGEVFSDLSSGGNWISKIQASLFTGGIDPGVLKEKLEHDASEKKTYSHMKLLKRKQGEKEEKEVTLEAKLRERDDILQSEKEIYGSIEKRKVLSEEIQGILKDVTTLKEDIVTQEKVREKLKLFRIVKDIDTISDNKKQLDSMASYEKDRSSEVKKLEEGLQKAKEKRVSCDAEVKSTAKEIASLEKEIGGLQSKANTISMKLSPLNGLLEQIEKEHPKSIIRQTTEWNKPVAVAGLCLAAAGIAAGVFIGFSTVGLAIMTLGIVAGASALFISRKTITREETPEIENFTRKMLKRWREIMGDDHEPVNTITELRETIIQYKSNYTQAQKTHKELSEQLKSLKDAFAEAQEEQQSLKDRQTEAEDAMKKWLTNMKVDDLKNYGEKLSEYNGIKKSVIELDQSLKKELDEYQCDNIGELKTKAGTLAARYEKDYGGFKAVSDTELTKLKKREKERSSKIEELRKEEKQLEERINKGTGQISGALGILPETIVELQRQISALDADIRELDLNRRAAGFAAEIFEEISKDSSIQFDIVSRDIADRFSEFLPGIDSIKIGSFSNDDILVSDAGGEFRPPEQLSTGTKDAFWFAARLSLALKANPDGPGIIVLDEPFHAFDDERMKKAIALLKKFHNDSGWQIVLFTWNAEVKEGMIKEFGKGIVVHDL